METPVLFSTFIMGLASAALIELGVIEDPTTKQKRVRKDVASQHIRVLEMLKAKTVGNLSEEERQLLDRMLTDLKLQFAKTSA